VAHDGYARSALDVAHERVAPARYDEVDVPILREQRGHFRARLDGLYERVRERTAARERGLDRACELCGRARGLFAPFENRGVACVCIFFLGLKQQTKRGWGER
jgi:hypothetical protein